MKSVSAYVNEGNLATFPCPSCEKTYSVSVDKYRNIKHRLTTKCSCEQAFVINLEFRQSYRKKVRLSGEILDLSSVSGRWSAVRVTDLSMGGLQFKLTGSATLQMGRKFKIKFTLDDPMAHQIERYIKITSIQGNLYGCEFLNPHYDKKLGYYLLPV